MAKKIAKRLREPQLVISKKKAVSAGTVLSIGCGLVTSLAAVAFLKDINYISTTKEAIKIALIVAPITVIALVLFILGFIIVCSGDKK